MKKWIILLNMWTLLTYSLLTIPVSAAEPVVRLPPDTVYVHISNGFNSSDHYFDITLTEVDPGYDITNGLYYGWCVERHMGMNLEVTHSVVLKSSYDTDINNGFEGLDWNKINYIINHRIGNWHDAQMAIWNITDGEDLTNYSNAQSMVNAANQNSDYVPVVGEQLAIPMVGIPTMQLAFLEMTIPGFEGFVWKDTDRNGLQNSNEAGLAGVTVSLYQSNGSTALKTTTTNSQGKYIFIDVAPGDYFLQFSPLSGYVLTTADVGSNDYIDSDAVISTQRTTMFTVYMEKETITKWDAGMYQPSSPVTVTPPGDTQQSTNNRPTADAVVGEEHEPYRGFINMNITFNASDSYDTDGRIITYRWNFGDGINATGMVATHSYATPNIYNVTLLVTDNKFAQDIDTTTAIITLGNNAPYMPVVTGPTSGQQGSSYQYTVLGIDPDDDYLRYVINWADGLQNTSPPVESGVSIQMMHQWSAAGIYDISVYALDIYNETSSTATLKVLVGVQFIQNLGYLIDVNGDGVYDKFHSNDTGVETSVVKQQDTGQYLLDVDGDGIWDHIYDPASGQTQSYTEQSPLLLYALIGLIILIIAIILIYFMMRGRGRLRTLSKTQSTDEIKK